jgi:signal transduction histidine kinase
VRFDELVRESVADTELLAQAQHLQVRLEPCDTATVAGDRDRLRQLLLDLADNAVKYNQRDGAVHFSLQCESASAVLTVSNTGPGLSPEMQGRVFERFFRGDSDRGNPVEGCGLGLSIAQWIAQAHGGRIDFASQPGALTTVTVRLPLMKL